jgi:hypothetical protein
VVDNDRVFHATRRRRVAERAWLVAVLGYSLLRIGVAKAVVARYGVNLWIFAIIEFSSSVPYGLGTARVVTSLVDRRMSEAERWGVIAFGGFLAPDLYVVIAGRHMPLAVYLVLAGWTSLMVVLALLQLRRRVIAGRAGLHVEELAPLVAR